MDRHKLENDYNMNKYENILEMTEERTLQIFGQI